MNNGTLGFSIAMEACLSSWKLSSYFMGLRSCLTAPNHDQDKGAGVLWPENKINWSLNTVFSYNNYNTEAFSNWNHINQGSLVFYTKVALTVVTDL